MRPTTRRSPGAGASMLGADLLDDVDVGLHAVGGAGRPHELAQRLDHAAALADQPPHVGGVGVHHQRHLVAALLDVDLDRVGVVGQVAGDVLGDGHRTRAGDAVALGADLVDEVVVVGVAHSAASSAGVSSAAASSAAGASAGASASGASAASAASASGASASGAAASAVASGAAADFGSFSPGFT